MGFVNICGIEHRHRPKQITTLRLEDFRPNAVGVRPAAEKSAMHRTGAGRVIILDARLHKYLAWWAWRHELRYDRQKGFLKPNGMLATGALFPEPLNSWTACKLFKRIMRRCVEKEPGYFSPYAGITDYSLRHTAATDFANAAWRAGMDMKLVADHLGCTVYRPCFVFT